MPALSFDEFKKKNPQLDLLWPYLELLNNESARGKVLVSTGFLEKQLEKILRSFMREVSEVETLFKGANAPLGSFSSRITICFTLGLIGENEHHDLQLIRKIRNDFAHDIHANFNTRSVIDRCRNLRLKVHDHENPVHGKVVVDPSGQFQTSAVALVMNLVNRPHYVSQQRRDLTQWPY